VEPLGEFVIEPPSDVLSGPGSHTSACGALDLIATLRSQSLFLAMTKHGSPGFTEWDLSPGLPRRNFRAPLEPTLPVSPGPRSGKTMANGGERPPGVAGSV
jgi:hypothetical protein